MHRIIERIEDLLSEIDHLRSPATILLSLARMVSNRVYSADEACSLAPRAISDDSATRFRSSSKNQALPMDQQRVVCIYSHRLTGT